LIEGPVANKSFIAGCLLIQLKNVGNAQIELA